MRVSSASPRLAQTPWHVASFPGSSQPSGFELFVIVVGVDGGATHRLLEPLGEGARRILAPRTKQLIPGGDFHEDGDAPPWCHRHSNERYAEAEDFVELVVQAEPLVLATWFPPFELDHEFDPLRRARRRDAEEILDVDDPDAPQFHVMARELGTCANQDGLGPPPDLNSVISHETLAADDQIERALALADAALADHQYAQTENIHQHCMQDRT